MQLYIIWILIISLFIGGYSFFLWKRSKRGYRFRARITIFFLLLTLIPIIPVTLMLSGTISQSLDTFISGDIERCLNASIDVIRDEVESKGRYYLQIYFNKNLDNTQKLSILDTKITSVRDIVQRDSNLTFNIIYSVSQDSAMSYPEITFSEFNDLSIDEIRSSITVIDNKYYGSIYKKQTLTSGINILYPIPENVQSAVDQINSNLSAYSPLYQLKETLIEENFIWAVAVIFVSIIAFMAILTARKLSRGITNPIFSLVEGFESVKEGDLDTRVDVKAKDEIEYLIDSFNKMVEELKVYREKLVYAEKIAAWRDVARSISHEIKNPLTPISLSISRIRKKIYDEGKSKDFYDECFSTIEEEIESLRRLASEFSEFARMPKPQFKEENLNSIVNSTFAMFQFNEKGVVIELDLEIDLKTVRIDREQIRRVLTNLINNAIDASQSGSKINIKSFEEDNTVYLEIKDSGSGIKKELLDKVFEPYFTTKSRGTGLGLPIVKRIIEEHSSEIQVFSKESEGTTFKIKFGG